MGIISRAPNMPPPPAPPNHPAAYIALKTVAASRDKAWRAVKLYSQQGVVVGVVVRVVVVVIDTSQTWTTVWPAGSHKYCTMETAPSQSIGMEEGGVALVFALLLFAVFYGSGWHRFAKEAARVIEMSILQRSEVEPNRGTRQRDEG